jgi:SAM-dependent methyltransferase
VTRQDSEFDARVEREKAFYDGQESTSYEQVRRLIARAGQHLSRYGDVWRYCDPREKTVLDYGCGSHSGAGLLRRGARHVTGIDVSEREIARARAEAADQGIEDRVELAVGDAHRTGFADESFDLIVGGSILHHLELERALREVKRLLRPGGRAVFTEPMLHNPLLRLGRLLTPAGRTADERPFTVRDWEVCARAFSRFEHHEREFITIPVMAFNLLLPDTWQARLAPRLFAIDDRLLRRFPFLRRYARITLLIFDKEAGDSGNSQEEALARDRPSSPSRSAVPS